MFSRSPALGVLRDSSELGVYKKPSSSSWNGDLDGPPPEGGVLVSQLLLHDQRPTLAGVVTDESGNGNDGQLVNGLMTYRAPGMIWKTKTWVFRNQPAFTLAFEFHSPDSFPGNMGIMGGNLNIADYLPAIRLLSTGVIQFFAKLGGVGVSASSAAGTIVTDTQYTVVLHYDGSDISLFVDDMGTAVATVAATGSTVNSDDFFIGGGNGGSMPVSYFGFFDFRVWSRGLSSAERTAYKNKTDISNTDLETWCPCTDNAIADIRDVSGTGSDLETVGSVTPEAVFDVKTQDKFFYLAVHGGTSLQYRNRVTWVPALASGVADADGGAIEVDRVGLFDGWGELNTVLDETAYATGDERTNPSFARVLGDGSTKTLVRYASALSGQDLINAEIYAGVAIHSLTDDGVWTWFGSNRGIVQSDGTILIGVVDIAGDQDAVVYDPSARTRNQWQLGAFIASDQDDHNNAGIMINDAGETLMSRSRHLLDNFSHYHRFNSPVAGDLDQIVAETSKDNGATATYNNVYKWSDGELWNIHRVGGQWGYSASTDDGITWGAFTQIYRSALSDNCYSRQRMNAAGDKLWIAANDSNPAAHTTSQYLFYIEQDGSIHEPDGTGIGALPLTLSTTNGTTAHIYAYTAAAVGDINDGVQNGRAWIEDLKIAPSGDIVMAFCLFDLNTGSYSPVVPTNVEVEKDLDRIYYYSNVWDGSSNTMRFVAHGGYSPSLYTPAYAPGITIHPDGDKFIYSSSSSDSTERASVPTNSRGWEIVTATWSGSSWSYSTIIPRTVSGQVAMRPCVASNGSVHYLLWMFGQYTYFIPATYYATEIKAIEI